MKIVVDNGLTAQTHRCNENTGIRRRKMLNSVREQQERNERGAREKIRETSLLLTVTREETVKFCKRTTREKLERKLSNSSQGTTTKINLLLDSKLLNPERER